MLLGSSVVEQVTVNHLVAGSNPARAAILCTRIVHKLYLTPRLGSNKVSLRNNATTDTQQPIFILSYTGLTKRTHSDPILREVG